MTNSSHLSSGEPAHNLFDRSYHYIIRHLSIISSLKVGERLQIKEIIYHESDSQMKEQLLRYEPHRTKKKTYCVLSSNYHQRTTKRRRDARIRNYLLGLLGDIERMITSDLDKLKKSILFYRTGRAKRALLLVFANTNLFKIVEDFETFINEHHQSIHGR